MNTSASSTTRRLTGLVLGGAALLLAGSQTGATGSCLDVSGTYTEQIDPDPDCTSPVGLCIEGMYQGSIRGGFSGEATALIETADTADTGVLLFISDSRIEARIDGLRGRLIVKNSGAFQPAGTGDIVDLQTIDGGTRDFAGATGAVRAEGTFTAGAGSSTYTGTVCLP